MGVIASVITSNAGDGVKASTGAFGVSRVFANGESFEGVYIISIGDCAKRFLHIIRLYKANNNQLEIIDYYEDTHSRVQVLLKDHSDGAYFLVKNITPRDYALDKYTIGGNTGFYDTFKVFAVHMKHNGVD